MKIISTALYQIDHLNNIVNTEVKKIIDEIIGGINFSESSKIAANRLLRKEQVR